tara:strand:+ start:11657 stop:11938 length:282 start_codon:yes stop_codon:yes gene_type:complete
MGHAQDFNDIDKALVDTYEPKLAEQFNELAYQANRMKNDKGLETDTVFLNEVDTTIEKIKSLSQDFLSAGGTESEFMLIVEKVTKDSFPNFMP